MRCYLCSSQKSNPYIDVDGCSHWNFEGVEYHLDKCENCGSVSSNPVPSSKTLTHFYKNHYSFQWFSDFLRAKERDADERVKELSSLFSSGNKILDFGGGLGYLSNAFKKNGFISEVYDQYTSESESKSAIEAQTWDGLVAAHVLEHSNDVDSMVLQMKSFLRPGGKLVLYVPNVKSYGYRKAGMKWTWAQPPIAHIHHISEDGLVKLLERHGFQIIEINYHERWDANYGSDAKHLKMRRFLGKLYWNKFCYKWNWHRKLIAYFTMSWRYFMVNKSFFDASDMPKNMKSELQIVAELKE